MLVVFLLTSSMVALLPFARETSMSNFFIYALLPIIFVYANKSRFRAVPSPSGVELVLAVAFIPGSFVFNLLVGNLGGGFQYGLTDYVLLCLGIFFSFYSIRAPLAQMGGLILAILRVATLALSMAYESAFVWISDFFVSIVVWFSRLLISSEVAAGTIHGEIFVGGQAGSSTVYIGWACAGLEELALISVILYILIASFHLGRSKTVIWVTIGIAGSFLVNIIRMTLLVWVAHNYGIDKMMWVHTHIGDVLFLVWIALFWMIFMRFTESDAGPSKTE